jgi:thiol:disulfide interchange protein
MYSYLNKTILILVTISVFSCKTKNSVQVKTEVTPYEFNFIKANNLNDVIETAKAQHKLVFLDMSASWCAPCQLMKRDVYTHAPTAKFFNDNFVNYLVDAEIDEGPDLKIIYNVRNYPTLLILDGKGRVVNRREGGTFHDALLQFGEEALLALPKM